MTTDNSRRIAGLQRLIRGQGLDSLLITSPADWYYLAGFSGEAGLLIADLRGLTLVTDGRFTVQAEQELSGVSVVLQKDGLYRTCGELLAQRKRKKVGFDAQQVTVGQLEALGKGAGRVVGFKAASGIVHRLRAVKDASELAQMRKAAVLASDVVESAIKLLKPGIREFEVAAEIEYQMGRRGAAGAAFGSNVSFGTRAGLPQCQPAATRFSDH